MLCTILLPTAAAMVAGGALVMTPPPTEKRPVTDSYHGVEVVDPYRWLEDWDDPEVKAWTEAQNRSAREYLDNLPDAAAIRERVAEVMRAPSVRHWAARPAGRRVLAMRHESGWQQPALVVFEDLSSSEPPRVLLDPAALPEEGAAIDWFVPSPDGELVAVSVSLAGTEMGDVRVLRTEDGTQVGEIVPRVNGGTAGGSLAWAPDGSGFYYSRYPRPGERPDEDLHFYTQVYYHALGTDSKDDRYETGKDFPKIAEIVLESEPRGEDGQSGGHVLASVQNGDGGEFIHLLRDPRTGAWTQFTRYEDRVVQAAFGPDGAIYLVSRKDAPRGKLLRLAIPEVDAGAVRLADARVIIPEQDDTLVSEFFEASNLCITDNLVYACYQLGGPSEIRVFDHGGRPRPRLPQPAVASAGGLAWLGGDDVLFATATFIQPTTWSRYAPGTDGDGKPEPLASLSTRSPVDFSAYEVVREMATSKDGTKVPLNIIRRKGAEPGSEGVKPAPCVVTGYGGYGVNIEPHFSAVDIVLLEQGFVLATANIRGGGEFGERWHREGNLENKQNVFDDFAAACAHMIDRGYTTSRLLTIEGGSNGGLLMGAMLTQHPEMFKAVVSHVGIYDMLRVELSPNGAFNIPEFGTVKEERLFRAMYAYSPYHRVRDGVRYPATLFLTGANDPRVDPMQSRKMTARLQDATAASPSEAPILLRTSLDTGHGAGTPLDERIAQTADVNAFLMAQLGVEYRPPQE